MVVYDQMTMRASSSTILLLLLLIPGVDNRFIIFICNTNTLILVMCVPCLNCMFLPSASDRDLIISYRGLLLLRVPIVSCECVVEE